MEEAGRGKGGEVWASGEGQGTTMHHYWRNGASVPSLWPSCISIQANQALTRRPHRSPGEARLGVGGPRLTPSGGVRLAGRER